MSLVTQYRLLEVKPAALISPEYCAEQRILHARPNGYGGKGGKWAPVVLALAARFDCGSILDFGCGEGGLMRSIAATLEGQDALGRYRLAEYDPAIEGKDKLPTFADLVVATDVLEHVEPDRLTAVLKFLRGISRKALFLVVGLDPTNKTLTDGRNAHLIQESPDWWRGQLTAAGFTLDEDLASLTLPVVYQPDTREKRWIAVAHP